MYNICQNLKNILKKLVISSQANMAAWLILRSLNHKKLLIVRKVQKLMVLLLCDRKLKVYLRNRKNESASNGFIKTFFSILDLHPWI